MQTEETPLSVASSPIKLAIFDFDYTLVNANSTKYLNKLTIERLSHKDDQQQQQQQQQKKQQRQRTPSIAELNRYRYPDSVELCADERDRTLRMNAVLAFMHERCGVMRADMVACLSELTLSAATRHLLHRLHQAGFRLAVVSDSISFVVETVLSANNVRHLFSGDGSGDSSSDSSSGGGVFANEAHFDAAGCLRVKGAARLADAPLCHNAHCRPNMCKGRIVREIIGRACSHGAAAASARVVYAGDGTIDYCAGLQLSAGDRFFVKRNSALERLLARDNATAAAAIKAQICLWKNAADIAAHLADELSHAD